VNEPKAEATALPPERPLKRRRESRLDWAALIKRVFKIDVLRCARCGGGMKVVAFVTEKKVVTGILGHLGLPTRAPPLAKAQAPPELALSA
jgi:hypothetical protein